MARTETAPHDLDEIVRTSAEAARQWAATSRADRANVLNMLADHLDAAAENLIPLAQSETHLTEGRLAGELKRTTFQLRLFAEVVIDGGYLDARIDHADPEWPMGAPRPDLRRTAVPLGPVVVFAASNFPFAFSVAGGDTASALAAGCPVILKAHDGHPELSAATAEIVTAALAEAGASAGLFQIIYGTSAGRQALEHPLVKAGAFTGSIAGGRALFDIANCRPEPIPFFGELGSVNPVFVTRDAAEARAEQIADEFLGSFTLGAGQFCTKPGLMLAPAGSLVLQHLATQDMPDAAPLLNDRITSGYLHTLDELRGQPGVSILAEGSSPRAQVPAPTILTTDVTTLLNNSEVLIRECFGPTALVVTYTDDSELITVAEAIDGQLTASVHTEPDDTVAEELTRVLATKAGRLLWNQWPTGVSVTYAQQHGGPYPATTSAATTSVGTAAIERFVRAVSFQGFPEALLPDELRDEPEAPLPRRIDGKYHG